MMHLRTWTHVTLVVMYRFSYMVSSGVFEPEDKIEDKLEEKLEDARLGTFLTQGLETKTGQESRSVVFREYVPTYILYTSSHNKSIQAF